MPDTGENTYRLKQADSWGNISYSETVTILYDANGSSNMFTVYPNPAYGPINISINTTINKQPVMYQLKIYDIKGSVVLQRASTSSNWKEDVSGFIPGLYIMQLIDGNGTTLGQAKLLKK
jgi:hypothetical protein